MENITKPVRTLSGSNFDKLLEDYVKAMDAIRDAEKAFVSIDFNARDYPEGFEQAKKERETAFKGIRTAFDYLEAVAIEVSSQA